MIDPRPREHETGSRELSSNPRRFPDRRDKPRPAWRSCRNRRRRRHRSPATGSDRCVYTNWVATAGNQRRAGNRRLLRQHRRQIHVVHAGAAGAQANIAWARKPHQRGRRPDGTGGIGILRRYPPATGLVETPGSACDGRARPARADAAVVPDGGPSAEQAARLASGPFVRAAFRFRTWDVSASTHGQAIELEQMQSRTR